MWVSVSPGFYDIGGARGLRCSKMALLAAFLGFAWRLYEYNGWMSLSGYRVEAQSPALERRLWDVFPPRCLRFWPFFLGDAEGVGGVLERLLPVSVSTRMPEWGRFVTTVKWLVPWVRVRWRGRVWCISREGRMWNPAELDELPAPAGPSDAEGPIWQFAQLSDDMRPLPSGVFTSPVSLDAIVVFLQEYQDYSWFGSVREIVLDRRAGADLFRLNLVRGKQRFEVLIQRSKYSGQELGAMLEEILMRLSKEGGNHRIDATYEGKVLLRKLPGGPKEGSLK